MSDYPYEYARCVDMEQIRESPETQSLEGFIPLLSITEGCGVLLIILMFVWTGYYRNGFSWRSNPQLEFNWHPLLMIIALVFLYANGIVYTYKSRFLHVICSHRYDLQVCFLLTAMLIYRTQRNVRKWRLKLTHAGMMLFIVLLVVIALVAVFDSHNLAKPPIPNMYSLHSWVGLTTVILFCCQVNLQYGTCLFKRICKKMLKDIFYMFFITWYLSTHKCVTITFLQTVIRYILFSCFCICKRIFHYLFILCFTCCSSKVSHYITLYDYINVYMRRNPSLLYEAYVNLHDWLVTS